VIALAPAARTAARELFVPDRPGPMVGLHVIHTGLGQMWVDRASSPRVALAAIGMDLQLAGDAAALDPDALRRVLPERGLVDAPGPLAGVLRVADPEIGSWDRVIATLTGDAPAIDLPANIDVRRLTPEDAIAVTGLSSDIEWISLPFEGARGLAASGLAFGAFSDERLVSAATPFHIGERFEDIGVVTESAWRGRGLNPACVARVVADIRARGRTPSWSTTPDNAASLRVAAKFGATLDRTDILYTRGFTEG